jgi:hypothetical protein
MSACDVDIVLYFYDEMDPAERARAAAHLRGCGACRQRLDDLHAIRHALAARPVVEAPPAGDWSGFMRRLDAAVAPERKGGRVRQFVALAATLALVTAGIIAAARFRAATMPDPQPAAARNTLESATASGPVNATLDKALREGSAEHLERSKLVVIGLTARDPRETTADEWQYERRLAGTLLPDTRLYRMAAQDRGVADVARVMRDLETVLLEAALSDNTDRDALERLQRLIAKRDLVTKMQVISTSGSAGL